VASSVRVETKTTPAQIVSPGKTDASQSPPLIAARRESAERLAALGKAALIYTIEHEDRLPDRIEDLPNEFGLATSWLIENVTYLGKRMRTSNEPDTPIAYDKTLLLAGQGTNALHLDTQVVFEGPKRLKELGIAGVPPESRTQLEKLGKSLLLYANRNQHKYPDTLQDARDYISRDGDYSWVLANVTYLGKGGTPREQPGRILAYDKTLLEQGKGSNALFRDCHVAWVPADRLSAQRVPMPDPAASDYEGLYPGTSGLLANLFVMGPSERGADVFSIVLAKTGSWTWNRTGRDHSKEAYDEMFNGTHNRTDHDVLILLFALDCEDRIPGGYEDLLPQAWDRIEEQLRQGKTVELSGRSRGLNVVLLATAKREQLKQAIAGSQVLGNPKGLLTQSGKGYDVAIEDFQLLPGLSQGLHTAVVSIRNRGDTTSPQVIVRFHAGDPTVDDVIHGAGPIQPGDKWNEGSADFALKEGRNEVQVVLDPDDIVDELDETNNRAVLRVVANDGRIVEQSMIKQP
jgi:hypothetical protein